MTEFLLLQRIHTSCKEYTPAAKNKHQLLEFMVKSLIIVCFVSTVAVAMVIDEMATISE